MKITEYLSEKNIFIGGHYQWPSLPDTHAIESTQKIIEIVNNNSNIISYLFIDDIGASAMCLSKCGVRKKIESIKSRKNDIVKYWIDQNIKNIEQNLIANNDNYIIEKFNEVLALIETSIILEKFNILEIILNFEKIIYAYNRSKSRPLVLNYILRNKLPQMILEKRVNNSTSKQLHRHKKCKNKNLIIYQKNDKYKYLISDYITDEDILLREEIIQNGKMIKASNRCPALLSTFFNKIIKDNIIREKSLLIFYFIPEEDRLRLKQGIISFMTLYMPEYKIKYEIKDITIITCIIQDTYLLDIYKYNLVNDIYSHSKKRVPIS